MYFESNIRTAAKAASWRLLATVATAVLVFIFTGRLEMAVSIGLLEMISKVGLYFVHERMWNTIAFGKREVTPVVVWLTGIPGAGKTTIATEVVQLLRKRGLKVEHLDGPDIRKLFPEEGYSREARDRHVRRIGHLAATLEKHGIFVVASVVSPYRESRGFVRSLCKNFLEVYVSTPVEECERRNLKGIYARARTGEMINVSGFDGAYEPPVGPELIVETVKTPHRDAATVIVHLVDQISWDKRRGPRTQGNVL